jgi:hypothetical protein
MSVIRGNDHRRVLASGSACCRVPACRLTPTQTRMLRYEQWRIEHEHGFPVPGGRPEPRSVSLIAAIYGVDESVVRRGIETIRREREALASVAAIAALDA